MPLQVAFKARSFNPFAFTRLLAEGRTMRLLVGLSCLTLPPLFMGDTLQVCDMRLSAFARCHLLSHAVTCCHLLSPAVTCCHRLLQVFAMEQWGLAQKQVAQLFTLIAVSGVIANSVGGTLIRLLGLLPFTLLATSSTLLFWLGFSSASYKAALICAAVGVLGPARTLGATTMMTTEGAARGIPQGQLSGDRANLIAWIKVTPRNVHNADVRRAVEESSCEGEASVSFNLIHPSVLTRARTRS